MVFVLIATVSSKQWVALTTFVPVKKFGRLSLKRLFNVVVKRELDEWRRSYIREKGFTVIEMWESDWWGLCRTRNNVNKTFLSDVHLLAAEQIIDMKNGKLFGYVQCELKYPKISGNFANFTAIFKNTLVRKSDIGDLIKTYAEEDGIMSQPRKMLISSFTLQNGTLITHVLSFYLELGLVCTRIHRVVE